MCMTNPVTLRNRNWSVRQMNMRMGSYCYDENGELICEKTEHQHRDDCFEEKRELVCETPESSGHTHTDGCYEKVLTCGKEVHTHSSACYHVDPAGRAATEAIAVASTESIAAAAENSLVDNLNATAENIEPERNLDSSTENSVIEDSTDASPDNRTPGSNLGTLTDEVSGDAPGAWSSTEAAADVTAGAAASTGSTAGATVGVAPGRETSAGASTGSAAGTAASKGASTGSTAGTAASTGAAAATSAAAGYVPVLDELDFNTLLNQHTGIYYNKPAVTDTAVDNETDEANSTADKDEEQTADAAVNTGEILEADAAANTSESQEADAAANTGEAQETAAWNRIDQYTELSESDNLRLYLAFTIPAGSLNETNQTARYRLPGNIRLTDEQVDKINTSVNGIAAQYVSYDTLEILDQEMYGKYLGIESVEGTRMPSDDLNEYLADNSGQEFISATVKVENVFDEDTGLLKAQNLVFTFAPYTIQKNQHQYDSDGKPTKAGEEVNGWLTIDINTEQIDWKKADDEMQAAKVVFVEKDKKSDLDEISTELKLTGMNNSKAEDGVSDNAEIEQVSYSSVSFDDSITVTSGTLSTDTDAMSGDAGTETETEITVHVEADKDTFPEGTIMVLSAVSDDQMSAVAEAVEGAVEAPKTRGFHAVDISFRDAEGNEIEPLKPIRVSMTSDAIKRAVEDESTAPVVVHVNDPAADKTVAVKDVNTNDGGSQSTAVTDRNTDDGESADAAKTDESANTRPVTKSSESTAEQSSANPEIHAATVIETDTRSILCLCHRLYCGLPLGGKRQNVSFQHSRRRICQF